MPNFGDFNFNDDADLVDTDPTPDNNGPNNFSSSDGIQNDQTNYHEPGEGPEIDGGDVSDFSTNTNPEEPSGQQDTIPPVNIDPDLAKSFNVVSKLNDLGLINTENPTKDAIFRAMFYGVYGIDPTGLDGFVGKLREAGYNNSSSVDFNHAAIMNRISNSVNKPQYEKPAKLEYLEDLFSPVSFNHIDIMDRIRKSAEPKYEYLEDIVSPVDFSYSDVMERIKNANVEKFEYLEDIVSPVDFSYVDIMNRIQNSADGPQYLEDIVSPVSFGYIGVLDRIFNAFSTPDAFDYLSKEFEKIYGDEYSFVNTSGSFALDVLNSFNIDEDDLDVILDTDDANPYTNPTGVGEFFDRTIIQDDQDISLSLGTEPIFAPIEPKAFPEITEEWFYAVEVMGAGAKEFMLEASDLIDDFDTSLIDVMYNSLDADLISIHDGALENFDGLL